MACGVRELFRELLVNFMVIIGRCLKINIVLTLVFLLRLSYMFGGSA